MARARCIGHQPPPHIAEGAKRRASQDRQNGQNDQQASSNALNRHARPTLRLSHSTPGNFGPVVRIPSS
jgi:hypothetical protein